VAGNVTVVNFCGSWSAQCREEQKVFAPLEPNESPGSVLGAVLIGVDERDSLVSIRAYVQRYGVKYPVIFDDGNLARAWGAADTVPITVVVDPQGRIAARFVGTVGRDQLMPVIKTLIAQPDLKAVNTASPAVKLPAEPSQTVDPAVRAKKIAAASAAAAQPEKTKGKVPSLPQASPAQTPAIKTAPPVKP
jgi:peroxiredoxin